MNFLLKLGVAALPIPFGIIALKKHNKELSKSSVRIISLWMALNASAICIYLVWGNISQYFLLAMYNGVIFSVLCGVRLVLNRWLPSSNKHR